MLVSAQHPVGRGSRVLLALLLLLAITAPIAAPTLAQDTPPETATDTPVPDEPTSEPVAEEPAPVDEQIVVDPVVEEPVIEEPAPVVEEPVVEEPVIEEPVVDDPVVDPLPAEPTGDGPTTPDLADEGTSPDTGASTHDAGFEAATADEGDVLGAADVVVGAANSPPVAVDDTGQAFEGSHRTIGVLANDSDPDGDRLSIVSISDPARGSAVTAAGGLLIDYTPDPDTTGGQDTFTYTISDGNGGTATATVTVTIIGVNDRPIAANDSATTVAGTAVRITVLANDTDPEGDALSIGEMTPASNGAVDWDVNNVVTYTPNPGFVGTDSFTYRAIDYQLYSNYATVTVTVSRLNGTPDAVDDAVAAVEDTALVVTVLANDTDPDGDALTVTGTLQPSHGTSAVNPDGTVTYTPNPNFTGSDRFTYAVTDGDKIDIAAVVVTVTAANDDPVAVDDSATTGEDTAVVIDVLANDTDIDGDALSVAVGAAPANGTVTVNGDGTVTYTPAANFNGNDSFTYVASDGTASDTASVSVTVNPVNDVAVAVDDAATTSRGVTIEIPVLANDIDADGDALFIISIGGSRNSNIVSSNGQTTIRYTPNPGFVGTDTVYYNAGDAAFTFSNLATVTVTVLANAAPVAVDDSATTTAGVPVDIEVRVNDSDPNGDQLSTRIVSQPTNGQASLPLILSGPVTYMPNPGFVGTDTFTYRVIDFPDGAESNIATVTVTVTMANVAPVAGNDSRTTDEDVPVTIDVLANDTDFDNDPLTVTDVSDPADGTAVVNPDGTVTYTPDPNTSGFHTFSYVVSDGMGGTDSAAVTVLVIPVDDAPVAADDAYTTTENRVLTVTAPGVLTNDVDPDGDPLSIASASMPTSGFVVVATNGSVVYTPAPGQTGLASFTYTVTDGVLTDTATVTITITPVNDPPVAGDDAASTTEDAAVTIDVLANDTDLDGDALVVVGASDPAMGATVSNADGTITYTPDPNANGTDTFDYSVSDGKGGVDTATVTVAVTTVNDAPVVADDTAATAEDTAVTISVLANDTDPDGDPLTVTGVTQPTRGTAAVNQDGTLIYSPEPDFNGTDSFRYTVTDGVTTATATVTVTVGAAGDVPRPRDDAASTAEDTAVTVAVLANDTDPDGDQLTVTGATDPARGTAAVNPDGTVTYTPDQNISGTDTFRYTVSDGVSSATAAVTITVTAVNDAPVAIDDSAATAEDTPVDIAVLANDVDPDGDPLTVVSTSAPTSGSVAVNADGTVTYTPGADLTGPDSFSYTVSDGASTDTATVAISVGPGNDAPVAADDSAVTDEGTAVTVAVLANDRDVDGDPLTVTAASDPARGSAVVNQGGTITYTPDPLFNGTDSFTYTVTDGLLTDTARVTVTVTPVNNGPDAVDDTATVGEDAEVDIDVLANDTDPEQDPLTVTLATDPANGTATVDQDGSIVYRPVADYAGADSFTYTVSDAGGDTATATVVVTVSPVNDAPIAADDAASTDEDEPVTIVVLANDTDIDGDALTVTGTAGASLGTTAVNPDGSVTYVPSADANGQDTFSYTVTDGATTDTATVTVTVAAVNDAPDAVDDTAATAEDVAVEVDVLANDTDVEGDQLTVSIVTGPTAGSATVTASGAILYTPDADATGIDTFTYEVSDGDREDTATLTVDVAAVNDAPVAVDDTAAIDEDTPVTLDVLANDTDTDGDALSVAGVTPPANGSAVVNTDGTVTYTPGSDFFGTDTLTYTVTDGTSSDSAVITVTVRPVNDAPTAADDAATTDEDVAVSIAVLANDADPDGDTLSVVSVTDPASGSAVVEADGTITYTPLTNASGTDSLSYTVSDGRGGSDVATVAVSVTPVNDPPIAVDDAGATSEDVTLNIPTADLLANDTDVDGGPLVIAAVDAASAQGGAVAVVAGTVVYTPPADFAGTDTFAYTVSDGSGGTDTAIVSVTVTAVNDAPVAGDDTATTAEDTAVSIAVRGNDTDVDGDALAVVSVTDPANGSAVAEADGTITYTPDVDYSGADTFTYTVADGNGGTDVATVTVEMTAVADDPTVVDDTATVDEDGSVTVDVLANDADADDDPLTVEGAGPAEHGTVVVNPDGTVTYTPSAGFNGTDAFPYTVTSGASPQAVGAAGAAAFTGTVTVTVLAVDDAPVAVDDAATVDEDSSVSVDVLANDTHQDGDPLTIAGITAEPSSGTTEIVEGVVIYTPAPGFSGTDTFSYAAADTDGDTAEATVTITVAALPVLDGDDDGVTDGDDNCPSDPNPAQEDADGDDQGDVCDDTPDGDPTPTPEPTLEPTAEPTRTPAAVALPNTGAGQAETAGTGMLAILLALAAVTALGGIASLRSRRHV